MTAVSARDIAAACRCSTASVSRALSGSGPVRAELAERIRRTAKRLGFERNPLIGSVMAQLRAQRTNSFKGNLAIVRVVTPGERASLPFHQRMFTGAEKRAAELGFHLELLSLGGDGNTAAQLVRILDARGILGLIMLHARETAHLHAFPWERFSAVEIDYSLDELLLDTVMIDHHVTLMRSLQRLAALGYRRGGFFIERFKNERLKLKWSAPFLAFQNRAADFGRVPLHEPEHLEEAAFMRWYEAHEPDLLVGHNAKVVDWLAQRGVPVPRQVGFFSLNWNERSRPCAGLDLRPEVQGAVAAETVIAQVVNRKRGLPADPHSVMVEGRWVNGPTLAKRRGVRAAARL